MGDEIYVISSFGCNSGYNYMYSPDIYVFKNKEEAYAFYTKEKNKILIMKEDYNIDYHVTKETDSECIIQYGYDNENGAKRPIGVIIKKCNFMQ